MFKADGRVSIEAGVPVKRFRKSARGMARDDGEVRSWWALCGELRKLNFIPECRGVICALEVQFFYLPFGSILEEELVVDQTRGRRISM